MAHVDLGGLWHEASFRLVETYDVQLERGWRVALDQQPYGEVVEVLSGTCRFELAGVSRDVSTGQVGVLLPGRERLTADVGEGPLHFRGFGFRVQLFGTIELSGLLGLPLAIDDPWPELAAGVAEAVRWGRVGGPEEAFRARAHAELATASLVEHRGDVRTLEGSVRPEVAVALALMDEDPARDLDVATLAAAVHLSPKHFSRTFKSVVGVPPMTYLQALRVSRARAALAASDRPVAAVAHDHGFADAAHFSRAFRQAYGTTPREFRARVRGLESSRRSSASRPRKLAG
jgi:AraC-like DNA-binding protein